MYKIVHNKKSFAELDFKYFQDLENLLEKPLATAMDITICRKFELQKAPLERATKVAEGLGKKIPSFSAMCAQKKCISVIRKGVAWTHEHLLSAP